MSKWARAALEVPAGLLGMAAGFSCAIGLAMAAAGMAMCPWYLAQRGQAQGAWLLLAIGQALMFVALGLSSKRALRLDPSLAAPIGSYRSERFKAWFLAPFAKAFSDMAKMAAAPPAMIKQSQEWNEQKAKASWSGAAKEAIPGIGRASWMAKRGYESMSLLFPLGRMSAWIISFPFLACLGVWLAWSGWESLLGAGGAASKSRWAKAMESLEREGEHEGVLAERGELASVAGECSSSEGSKRL